MDHGRPKWPDYSQWHRRVLLSWASPEIRYHFRSINHTIHVDNWRWSNAKIESLDWIKSRPSFIFPESMTTASNLLPIIEKFSNFSSFKSMPFETLFAIIAAVPQIRVFYTISNLNFTDMILDTVINQNSYWSTRGPVKHGVPAAWSWPIERSIWHNYSIYVTTSFCWCKSQNIWPWVIKVWVVDREFLLCICFEHFSYSR